MVYFDVSGMDAPCRLRLCRHFWRSASRNGGTMKILEHYRPLPIEIRNQTNLISVIVAAYNIADYIERGINSIRSQTYQNLEIIVVDDGSTDTTGDICDRLAMKDARVQVIHKENGGPAQARNVGIARAKGSYIGFVDGDDWIDPDMYEKMLGALKEQEADIAICRYRQVHKTHTEDLSVDRAVVFEEQEALQYYVQETKEYAIQNAAWNKLYKREILTGIAFPPGKWYEDIMFATMALARAGRCVYLDTAYYNYIIDREGSIMNTQINPRTFTDQIPAYYEKTKFLIKLGRQDLADVHDYFFYKRLLLFYDRLQKTDVPDKDQYLEQIKQIIRDNSEHYEKVYACPVADPRDYAKIKLFLKSPARYERKMQFEEQIVIPLKVKVKRILGK